MKRIVAVLFLVVSGFVSTGNACEELRRYPGAYEVMINKNAKGMGIQGVIGNLDLIAATPAGHPGGKTYIFIKSEIEGERDIWFLQETNKNCDVIDQDFFFDYDEVKRIIKQKGMKEL